MGASQSGVLPAAVLGVGSARHAARDKVIAYYIFPIASRAAFLVVSPALASAANWLSFGRAAVPALPLLPSAISAACLTSGKSLSKELTNTLTARGSVGAASPSASIARYRSLGHAAVRAIAAATISGSFNFL